MGWMSVVATGLVVRGAVRRRQRRELEIERARAMDVLRGLTEDTGSQYTIWPPEHGHDQEHDGER
jgi:hypothetical protein